MKNDPNAKATGFTTTNVSAARVLARHVEAYQQRTGRSDGLTIIRDHLSVFGAQRFRELRGMTAVKCMENIIRDLKERA